MKTYTGIGSRETPAETLLVMRDIATRLGALGWVLRSGAADGADRKFEEGAWDARFQWDGPAPEVYLPWPSFQQGNRAMLVDRYYVSEPQPEAFEIARRFHPAWDQLSRGAMALHARNVHQILGPDVSDPILSRFVICWTKDAKGGGGTGQALRIAKHFEVPVFDLAEPAALERVLGLLR